MAEIWGAAIAVGGSLLSGIGKEKQDKENKAHDAGMTFDGAKYNAMLSQFEGEQADYYSQLNRQRKQRGLDNFRQFSQVGKFAPNYAQTTENIVLPEKPTAEATFSDDKRPSMPQQKSRSTLNKVLDPLGLFG